MCPKINFVKTDKRLKYLISLNPTLSKSRKKTYNAVFNEIYELFDVTPTQLVELAKKEQKPFATDDGSWDILEMEDRTITQYQTDYYNYLKYDKDNADSTIKMKLKTFRAIFTTFQIERPPMIKINTKKSRVREEDIPSWDDVRNAVSLSKNIRDKSLILYLATTGLRISDSLNILVSDLLEACSIYFKDENYTIDDLLEKDPWQIIPCYDLDPQKTSNQGNITITFNTPECSYYLWQQLKERREKGPIDPSEPLFKSERKFDNDGNPTYGFLKVNSMGGGLNRLNKEMGNERDRNEHYGKFRAHNLRTLFSTTCRKNMSRIVVNADKTTEMDLVSLFTGHIPPNMSNSDVYEAVGKDSHDSYIRKTYEALVPYLSIQPTEVKDFKPEQYKELEERNEALENLVKRQDAEHQRDRERNQKNLDAKDKRIRELENKLNNMNERIEGIEKTQDINPYEDIYTFIYSDIAPETDNPNRVIRIMEKLAKTDIENGFYTPDEEYLTGLYNNAINYIRFNIDDILKEEKLLEQTTNENTINTKHSIKRRQEIDRIANQILDKFNINFTTELNKIIDTIIKDIELTDEDKIEQFKEEFCTTFYPKLKDKQEFKKYIPQIKDNYQKREKLDAYLGLYNKITLDEEIDEERITNIIKNVLTKNINESFEI